MNQNKTVVVAMSGGVDSSTTAALLAERGYNVIGMMMQMWAEGDSADDRLRNNRCCSPAAVADARAVCQNLGIPFYFVNFEDEFKTRVVDYFLEGYEQGITPNPCIVCNRFVKFGALKEKAQTLGGDFLATGHYARIRKTQDSEFQLLKGVDPRKDQSYALHALTQEQLAHVLFPLGEFTKDQTREMARHFGLRVADKADSQDLCFVKDNDYRGFLRRQIPNTLVPGDIVDTRGNVLGQHQGLALYTIGQRKGLGIACGEPLFVMQLDVHHNALVVGRENELGKRELVARNVNLISGRALTEPLRVTVKIRYRANEAPATITPIPDPPSSGTGASPVQQEKGAKVRVTFDQPLRDITPGQYAVFYDGDVCLGGGMIGRE